MCWFLFCFNLFYFILALLCYAKIDLSINKKDFIRRILRFLAFLMKLQNHLITLTDAIVTLNKLCIKDKSWRERPIFQQLI